MQEQKAQYAGRQAERFGRLARYLLDSENKRKYSAREKEWENVVKQNFKGTSQEKALEKVGKSSTMKLDKKIPVVKSLSAAGKNYPVKLPDSRQHTKLVEGQTIHGKTFAGKNTDTEIRERYRLESLYKKPADEREKVSGKGKIIVAGKERLAELHW